MLTDRVKFRCVTVLAVVMVASLPPAVQAGPISDMVARHRARQQLQLPPMEKPFTGKAVKDISPSSLKNRFKKRFSASGGNGARTASNSGGGLGSMFHDSGVSRTSR